MNEQTNNTLASIERRRIEEDLMTLSLSNPSKKVLLKHIDDTYSGMPWVDFIEIAKAYGFKSSYYNKFMNRYCEDFEEEEIIFFHEEKGLILYAESFTYKNDSQKSVNRAHVYGEIKCSFNTLLENPHRILRQCNTGSTPYGTIYIDVDVYEGLRCKLDGIAESFEFMKIWNQANNNTTFLLFFLNNRETMNINYNSREINRKKIDACTPEVRKIIFG